jgi:hypothetical protein
MNIRLCYASSRHELIDDLIEDLSDILTVARDFNSKNEIFGVYIMQIMLFSNV